MDVYGHNQFNLFFVPLIKVDDDGFLFKDKSYSWRDVKDVIIWDPFPGLGGIFGTGTMPRATIFLNDGKKIKIHARVFVKKGTKSKVGFLSCKSEAFEEIIALFKNNQPNKAHAL
jgi:hypothetical protein